MRHAKILVAAVTALSGAFVAGSASANVITINGGAGSLTCTPSCSAFTGANPGGEPSGLGVLSSTNADEYAGAPASEASEVARLNTLAGTSFSSAGLSQIDGSSNSGGNPDDQFDTFALYVIMKIGNDAIFIKNTSGGKLTIAYDSFAGQGSGLSHRLEVGTAAVPVPAALWLMGSALAGLGLAGRRKKKV